MDMAHLVILAFVQGITEFLPISSSAHLILLPRLTGWVDQGLKIDVAMHMGSLAAVVVYFRRECGTMFRGALGLARGMRCDEARLTLNLLIGTLPVAVAGYLLKDLIAGDWRSAALIAWTTIGFGLLLFLADRRRLGRQGLEDMPFGHALLVGLAQALALVPGVSRSGITMTAGLFLGYGRTEAARFSLLLSIPTTFAAGVLAGVDLYGSGDASLQKEALVAAGLSFVAALAAISVMMRWLRRASFTPFVVYRLLLGAGLLAWLYF